MTKAKVLALLLPVFCFFLLQPFLDPDSIWPTAKFAGLALLCIMAAGSCFGLGFALTSRLKLPIEVAAPISTLLLSLFLFLMGLGGAWGGAYWFLYLVPLGLGLWFLPDALKKLELPWPLAAALGLVLLLALVPSDHPDPLYYNLLGARLWYDSGRIDFFASDPLLFLSGLWDALYVWPIAWIRLAPGQELISQQIAAQFMVALLGFGGLILLLFSYAKRLGEGSALVLFALASPVLLLVSFTAKNDWGVLLWLAGGALLFERKNFAWSGALLAAAVSTKWTSVFVVGWIFLFFFRLLGLRGMSRFFIGFLPVASLVFARNYWHTGAPLFPHFAFSHLSSADLALFRDLGFRPDRISWNNFSENLFRFFTAQPASFGCLFLPVVWQSQPQWRRSLTIWFSLLIAFTFFFALILHPALSWRVVSPLPILWSLSGGVAALFAIRVFSPLHQKLLGGVLASLFFLWALAPALPQIVDLFQQPGATIRGFAAGDAMAFVRLQPAGERVVVGGNPQLFYLSHLPALTLESSLPEEALLAGPPKAGELILGLRSRGFRWFIETKAAVPLGLSSALISVLAEKYGDAIAYRGRMGRVVDLAKLEEIVRSPAFVEPELEEFSSWLPEQK